jgi:hypothetical protein
MVQSAELTALQIVDILRGGLGVTGSPPSLEHSLQQIRDLLSGGALGGGGVALGAALPETLDPALAAAIGASPDASPLDHRHALSGVATAAQVAADFTVWSPDAPPAVAGALDDEFDGASGGVPPGWTEVDHGGVQTVSEDEAGLKLEQATHAGDAHSGIYKAIPAGDFTIWTKASLSGAFASSGVAGIALWQDATAAAGDLVILDLIQASTETFVAVQSYTAYNVFSANLALLAVNVDVGITAVYLRVRRTGTTYAFEFSTDGIGWIRIFSTAALPIVPAHVGPDMSNANSGVTVSARFPFLRYVASDVGITGLVSGDRINAKRA